MTIKEYKEKFIELANQMEQEHGTFINIAIACETSTYDSTLQKSTIIVSKKNVVINF